MAQTYAKKAQFIFIYIREAHAADEWPMDYLNEGINVNFKKPKVLHQRIVLAQKFVDQFQIKLPIYVDGIDDTISSLYSAAPERLYIIKNNRVNYKGGPGPMCYDLEELELHLQQI